MRNFKLLISLIFVFLFFLFGSAFARTQISFWYSVPEEYNVQFEKLIDKFNEEHQYYHVAPKNFKSPEDLKKALDEGKSPDVAIIDACWQSEFANSGRIIPVEDLMNEVGTTLKVVLRTDTFKTLWDSCLSSDGKLWSLPYYVLNQALIYDSKLLNEKKIKQPPKSWSEIIKISKTLTSSEDEQWGFLLPLHNATSKELASCFQAFLWQAGGTLYDGDGRISINDDKAVKALGFLKDLVKKYKVAPLDGQNVEKAAMRVGTIEDFLKLKAKGYDVKVAPLPKYKKDANVMQLSSLAVFKTEREVEPAKCWYFIYWLSEFPQASALALNTPYIPANKQVTLSPEYFNYLEKYPEIRVYLVQLKNSKIRHNLPGYDKILAEIGSRIKKVIVEDTAVEDELNQLTVDINSKIDLKSFDNKSFIVNKKASL